MSEWNEYRGHFKVDLGDKKERYLRFGHDQLAILDLKYGSTMKVMAELASNPASISPTFIMDALLAGLQHHGSYSKGKLQALIPTHKVMSYIKPVLMALLLANRGPEEFAKALADAEGETAVEDADDAPVEGADANPPMTTAGESSSP